MGKRFIFQSKVWQDPKSIGWYFIDIDKALSDRIKRISDKETGKLGLVKAIATVGSTSWKTTLFPTKREIYVMSIIKTVRQKEKVKDKDTVKVKIEI